MPLLRWSNPGHDTRRASSLVREAGCREINLHIRRWENNVLDIPFYRSLLRKMPLLRWSNPGHDTRRASSLVREAGCREINLHIRRWENNVLDIPFYRSLLRKMPLLRWSNPGHDTRRASSLVREAGCRERKLHIRRWENNVLDIPFHRTLLRKMPLLRWSNPGHDTRRASSLVREAGCRE